VEKGIPKNNLSHTSRLFVMKIGLRTIIIALLLSGFLGYFIAFFSVDREGISSRAIPDTTSLKSDELDSLKKQISELEDTVRKLEKENRELQLLCEEVEATKALETNSAAVATLRDQWIQEIIDKPGADTIKKFQSELADLQRRFHLTADQMIQLGPLLKQRGQISRMIMLRHIGLISQQDFDSRFAVLKEFNFDQAVANLLSEEQKTLYLDQQNSQRNKGLNIAAYSFAERYNITNSERFSPKQQTSIQNLLKQALVATSDLEIPPSIQELDIDVVEKRMLSLGYEQLDTETFKKMYETLVENHENNSP
jgi:hypothetical protein